MPHSPTEVAGPPIPDRFRVARELRGKTQREVVESTGGAISAPALSQIESGKLRPSEATVISLGHALKVPAGFFSAQWPDTAEGATFFRDLRSTSVRVRRQANAQTLLLSTFITTLGSYVRFPEVEIPDIEVGIGAPENEIEQTSRVIRNAWNLGADPIKHVVRELERHGIAVARLFLGGQSIDAFSTWTSERPLVILSADKTDNYVRSRFDAAHELGHLVMHRGAEHGSRELEKQANIFASALLIPDGEAQHLLPRRLDASGWARLAELKRTWGISMAALLYRAKSLSVLSPDAYQSAMRYMSARGWRRQEPGDAQMGAPEAPLLLERSVRRAEIEAGLSIDNLIDQAYLPLADMHDLLRAAVDVRPMIEL